MVVAHPVKPDFPPLSSEKKQKKSSEAKKSAEPKPTPNPEPMAYDDDDDDDMKPEGFKKEDLAQRGRREQERDEIQRLNLYP